MKILALDLGTKTLGISISDENKIFAIPKENFLFDEGDFDSALERVKWYLANESIEMVLLGYPLKTNGDKATITFLIEDFHLKLKNIVQTKLVDERYSTKRSLEMLSKSKKILFKDQKDLMASWVLLSDYLNQK